MPSSAAKSEAAGFKFSFPWGLLIVLTVYALCVLGYVYTQYWDSPEYKAAEKYALALSILGVDDGRKCSEADLNRAFELTMQTGLLMPDELQVVEHLESLRHRFEERKFKLKAEWVKQVEMMSAHTLRIEQSKKGWLVVSQHDKGWAPDQLLQGPRRAVLWSIPGGVFIIAFWAYGRFSSKARLEREHEEKLKAQEREVEALGDFRKGLRPAPQVEDDADTTADAPVVRARPPTKSGVKAVARPATKSGVKAVARPPTQGSGVKAVSRPPTLTARPALKKRPPDDE